MTDKCTSSPCERCTCALGNDELETVERSFPVDYELCELVREYLEVNGYANSEDFISRVEICPQGLVLHVEDP